MPTGVGGLKFFSLRRGVTGWLFGEPGQRKRKRGRPCLMDRSN